jgi:hypothetical protein
MSASIFKGKLKLALFSSAATFGARKFRDIENTSVFRFSFTETEATLPDYRDASGGTDASFKRIESVTGQIDPRHFTAENWAMVLWGTTDALAATPIVGEARIIRAGAFIPTDRIIDTAVAPVVKKGATVIDVADYTVSPGGITIAATITTATVVEDDAITIDYTPQAGYDVQTLVGSAPLMSLFFEGVNAINGKSTVVRGHKVRLGVAQNVDMIAEGDTFGTMTVTLTFEKDETVVAAGKSKYIEVHAES